jgi:hypothetical protein
LTARRDSAAFVTTEQTGRLASALGLAASHAQGAECVPAGFAGGGIFGIARGSKWRENLAVVALRTDADLAGVEDRVVLTRHKEMGSGNDAGAQ